MNRNIPFEKTKQAHFYDVNSLLPEKTLVDIGIALPVSSGHNRGNKLMYFATSIASRKKHWNAILKENIPYRVELINRGPQRKSAQFAICVNNIVMNAVDEKDALQIAETVLSILCRDKKAVLTVRITSPKN